MRRNPRGSDHAPGSPIRLAQEEFNRTYRRILQVLEEAFDGGPESLGRAVGAMYGLKAQAESFMQTPTVDGLSIAGTTCEYVPPRIVDGGHRRSTDNDVSNDESVTDRVRDRSSSLNVDIYREKRTNNAKHRGDRFLETTSTILGRH